MEHRNNFEQTLRVLTAPRRNRYYYGKMLDVIHLQMEQDHGRQMRWLDNRLSLGTGVLCGLRVFAQDGTLCVDPGVAVDASGREIVVPVRSCLDPWKLADSCGQARARLPGDERHLVTLYLCHDECLTDHAPVLVSDCDPREASEAGTVVETFRLEVREGLPEPGEPLLPPECCDALFASSEGSPGVEADRPDRESGRVGLAELLCRCTAQPCPVAADDCVPLAAIELREGGEIGRIDECAVRTRLYSNQMLLELILCLAARLDECCNPQDPDTESLPKVAAVKLLDIDGAVIAELTDPSKAPTLQRESLMRSLRIVFTEPIDRGTVVAGSAGANPQEQSFLVTEQDGGLVPGTLTFENQSTVRWDMVQDAAPMGRYTVRLSGDADPSVGRPAITSSGGVRLDAEPFALPSGDDVEGGVFRFRFVVADGDGPGAPPAVASVYIVSSQNVVLVFYTDPRDVPSIDTGAQPKSIRIDFTADIDPQTLVATAADPEALNFRVVRADGNPVAGAVTVESPSQVRWTATVPGTSLEEGEYTLELFGDAVEDTGRPAIAGVDGLRLDGEPGEELPSGDGNEGGEFRIRFRVAGRTPGGDRS